MDVKLSTDVHDYRDVSDERYSQFYNTLSPEILIGHERLRLSDFLTSGTIVGNKVKIIDKSFPEIPTTRHMSLLTTKINFNKALFSLLFLQDELHATVINVNRLISTVLNRRGYISDLGEFIPLTANQGGDLEIHQRTMNLLIGIKKVCDIYLNNVYDWNHKYTYNSQQRLLSKKFEQIFSKCTLYWRRENNFAHHGLVDTSEKVFMTCMENFNLWGLLTSPDGNFGGQVEYVEKMLVYYYFICFGEYREAGRKIYGDALYVLPNENMQHLRIHGSLHKDSVGAFLSSEILGLLLNDSHIHSSKALASPITLINENDILNYRQYKLRGAINVNEKVKINVNDVGTMIGNNLVLEDLSDGDAMNVNTNTSVDNQDTNVNSMTADQQNNDIANEIANQPSTSADVNKFKYFPIKNKTDKK